MTTAVDLKYAHMQDADAFLGLKSLPVDTAAVAGDHVVISGISKKTIQVYRLEIVVSAAMTLTFKDGPSNSLSGGHAMLANGSMVLDLSNVPWFQTSASNDFIITTTGTGQVEGTISFVQN